MEENNKEIVKEVLIKEEEMEITPATQTVEASEAETTEAPAAAEKKETTRRKKRAAPETKTTVTGKNTPREEAPGEKEKKMTVPRLKPSLRQGFQLKGRYYSSTELRHKTVLEKLYKQYPGLFEK